MRRVGANPIASINRTRLPHAGRAGKRLVTYYLGGYVRFVHWFYVSASCGSPVHLILPYFVLVLLAVGFCFVFFLFSLISLMLPLQPMRHFATYCLNVSFFCSDTLLGYRELKEINVADNVLTLFGNLLLFLFYRDS